jgi:energy-coupling factor transporter ATP-binding protein EcfA2
VSTEPSTAHARGDESVEPAVWSDRELAEGAVDSALETIAEALQAGIGLPTQDAYYADEGAVAFKLSTPWRGMRVGIVGVRARSPELTSAARRLVADLQRESLTLIVLPDTSVSFVADIMPDDSARLDTAVPLFRVDIEALRSGATTIAELFDFKIVRRIFDGADLSETQYAETLLAQYRSREQSWDGVAEPLEDAIMRQADNSGNWVEHPLLSKVRRRIGQQRGVVLIGPSGSGKSILAFQVAQSVHARGTRTAVIQFSALREPLVGFSQSLLFGGPLARLELVLMLDDLQSQPTLARYCLAILNVKRRVAAEGSVVAICTTWPDFGKAVVPLYEQCYPQFVEPRQLATEVIESLAPRIGAAGKALLLQRFGDDIGILSLAARESAVARAVVGLTDVAAALWEARRSAVDVSEDVCSALALVCGSLSRYDLPTSPQLLSRLTGTDPAVQRAATPGLLRRVGDGFSLGHRSTSGLLVEWLGARGEWLNGRLAGVSSSDEVVLGYLRELSPAGAVEALRGLQTRLGFRPEARMARRAAAVVQIWEAFSAVIQRIEHQQELDPTWGRNPASAMFAVRALQYVGRPEAARASFEFLSKHWDVIDGEVAIELEGLSTVEDFIRIGERMQEEDKFDPQQWGDLPAGEVDLERFHRTWLAGVLLSAEAFDSEIAAVTSLVDSVEHLQEPDGSFYPRRVPWSTARVLLGLAACGRNVENSRAVHRAAAWLLRQHSEGGAYFGGVWMSGTGTWNSTLETTAMVLMALAAVGIDPADERLVTARNYLLSMQPQWTAPGFELEGALAAQAVLESGGDWDEVTESVYMLSRWAQGEAFWQTANLGAHDSLAQGCRVAQIASHLVDIGWRATAADLPAFLEALAPPDAFRRELLEEEQIDTQAESEVSALVAADRATEPTGVAKHDELLLFLRSLDELRLADSSVVGSYRRFSSVGRERLRRAAEEISRQLGTQGDWHKNFLIWAPPGTGKSFFVGEIARANPDLRYETLNLAKVQQEEWEARIQEIAGIDVPTLCLIDEVDARADEPWPYQSLFSLLDLSKKRPIVFVLVGSLAEGKESLVRFIEDRPKGRDLIDRIPARQRLEIPLPELGDRLLIFVTALIERRTPPVQRIEKFALYYALSREELKSSRQVEDFAVEVLSRLPTGQVQVFYDSLFLPGDRENQHFYAEHINAALELDGSFVHIHPA